MDRICPRCKKNLSNAESFFCLSCGYKLEDALILLVENKTVKTQLSSSKVTSLKLQKKEENRTKDTKIKLITKFTLIISVLLLFLFIIFLLIRFMLVQPNTDFESTRPVTQKIYQNTVKSDFKIPSGTFFDNDIGYIALYDSAFYLEGFDFSALLKSNVSSDIIDSNFSKILPYINGQYALFGQKIDDKLSLGAAFLLNNEDLEIENLEISDNLYADIFNNFLIISDNKSMIDEMRLNLTRQQKSLMHNPNFVMQTNVLEKDGQLIFINLCDFKLEEIVSFLYNYLSSGYETELLNKIVKLGYNKLVIK